MRSLIHRVALLLLLGMESAVLLVPSAVAETTGQRPAPDVSVGRAAYERQCARCHGVAGKGDGLDAKRLYPRPRDLTAGVFKFRSTASGTAPTDEDLFQTLTNGLPGTGMPDWSHLDESMRWQLVEYVKSLSSVFHDAPPQPVALGTDPGPTHADLAKGRAVYERLGCAACHGPAGRGNGPSTATLVDNWSRPIRAKDLTEGWNYRGGHAPSAVVRRILTGIDGTPMPSYAEAVSTEDAWQLAYYVHSLQEEAPPTGMVHAARIEGPLPQDADDPRWAQAEPTDLRLRNVVDAEGQIERPVTVTRVSLRVVHNDEAVAFRLAWDDASEDRPPAASDGGRAGAAPFDAVALALHPQGVAGDVVSLQAWPLRDAPPLDLCLWTAGQTDGTVREAVVKDYEALRQGMEPGVVRKGTAAYHEGAWTVVLTRPFAPADLPQAASLAAGRITPVAAAVWDGGNAGQRSVSTWVDVIVGSSVKDEPPRLPLVAGGGQASRRATPPFIWIIATVVLAAGLWLAVKPR